MIMYDFIAIDFETANRHLNSACSIGLAAVRQGEIVETAYHLIQPPTPVFAPENVRIHGITWENVREAKPFPAVWEQLAPFFEQAAWVIAHNVRFDLSVLRDCADTYQLSLPDFSYLDSIRIASAIKHTRGYSLTECARFFHVDPGCHHQALDDAVACARIVLACLRVSACPDLAAYRKAYPQLRAHCFRELTPFQSFSREPDSRRHFSSVRISDITAETQDFDPHNPLYQKNVVFTGDLLSLDREEAMQLVVNAGGVIKSSVSRKTQILVVGSPDPKFAGEDGMSTKERKARELNAQGCSIQILTEKEFLELLRPM